VSPDLYLLSNPRLHPAGPPSRLVPTSGFHCHSENSPHWRRHTLTCQCQCVSSVVAWQGSNFQNGRQNGKRFEVQNEERRSRVGRGRNCAFAPILGLPFRKAPVSGLSPRGRQAAPISGAYCHRRRPWGFPQGLRAPWFSMKFFFIDIYRQSLNFALYIYIYLYKSSSSRRAAAERAIYDRH
jgi:hypothetical protein